ncbi:MAG: hypothetical protein ABSG30_09955 [Steroidobacteraceae bacterium]
MDALPRLFSRITLACIVLSCAHTSALGQGTVTIHVLNDTTDNLEVTLYDRNLRRHQMIISGQVIYGNASIATTISADSSGQGRLYWKAITTDRDMRRCGQHEKSGLNDGDTVHVWANSRCSH